MTDLAHIRFDNGAWALIRRFEQQPGGGYRGAVIRRGGVERIGPIEGPADFGDDGRIVPVETAVDDQSTTSLTATAFITAVEETRVVDTTVVTDVPVTAEMVAAERQRRFDLGFDYDFGDARGVHHFGTTADDMKGWDEVTQMSQAAIAVGAPSTAIGILTETGPATITALEWQSILLAAGAARQPLWAASFALQAMDPIPADYATNETYWSS